MFRNGQRGVRGRGGEWGCKMTGVERREWKDSERREKWMLHLGRHTANLRDAKSRSKMDGLMSGLINGWMKRWTCK